MVSVHWAGCGDHIGSVVAHCAGEARPLQVQYNNGDLVWEPFPDVTVSAVDDAENRIPLPGTDGYTAVPTTAGLDGAFETDEDENEDADAPAETCSFESAPELLRDIKALGLKFYGGNFPTLSSMKVKWPTPEVFHVQFEATFGDLADAIACSRAQTDSPRERTRAYFLIDSMLFSVLCFLFYDSWGR